MKKAAILIAILCASTYANAQDGSPLSRVGVRLGYSAVSADALGKDESGSGFKVGLNYNPNRFVQFHADYTKAENVYNSSDSNTISTYVDVGNWVPVLGVQWRPYMIGGWTYTDLDIKNAKSDTGFVWGWGQTVMYNRYTFTIEYKESKYDDVDTDAFNFLVGYEF